VQQKDTALQLKEALDHGMAGFVPAIPIQSFLKGKGEMVR